MKKESSYRDFSPRSDRIYKLSKKAERFNNLLRDSRYEDISVMLSDVTVFLNSEKEIEIQKCYLQLEEMYWAN